MSSRLVKQQLVANKSEQQHQQHPTADLSAALTKRRLKKKKAKQLKAVAENQKKQDLYGKNLAYFRSTKGTQGATAHLMAKVSPQALIYS